MDRQHRSAGCVAPPDASRLWHERARALGASWWARAAQGRNPARIQEHEVPPAHRRDGHVRRWRQAGEHPERVVVVRGDLIVSRTFFALLLLASFAFLAGGARTQDSKRADAGHRGPLSPQEALTSFELEPGYRIELAASEPLTKDPVAIAFDDR